MESVALLQPADLPQIPSCFISPASGPSSDFIKRCRVFNCYISKRDEIALRKSVIAHLKRDIRDKSVLFFYFPPDTNYFPSGRVVTFTKLRQPLIWPPVIVMTRSRAGVPDPLNSCGVHSAVHSVPPRWAARRESVAASGQQGASRPCFSLRLLFPSFAVASQVDSARWEARTGRSC